MKFWAALIITSLFLHSPLSLAEPTAQSLMPTEDIIAELTSDEEMNSELNDEAEVESPTLQTPYQLSLDHLKIVGRGIENRKTHEVIVLACVGENIPDTNSPSCKKLRHVLLKEGSNEVRYLGYPYATASEGDSEPSQKDLKSVSRNISKNAKWQRRFYRKRHQDKFYRYALYAVIGVPLAVGCMVGAGIIIPNIIFGGTIGIVLLRKFTERPFRVRSGNITEMTSDQNGWNWSVNPKKVSNKTFTWFENYLGFH